MVINKKKTLSKASRKLKISISTAKSIVDRYMKTGKILNKEKNQPNQFTYGKENKQTARNIFSESKLSSGSQNYNPLDIKM